MQNELTQPPITWSTFSRDLLGQGGARREPEKPWAEKSANEKIAAAYANSAKARGEK